MAIFTLAPDQTIAQMWSNGVRGGASFDSLTQKTPCSVQRSWRYLLHKLSYSRFYLKFGCHGNIGHPGVNLNYTVKVAVPENHILEPKITTLSCIQCESKKSSPCGFLSFFTNAREF